MLIPLDAILKILPHRPPFLFLDRVEEVEPLKHGAGIKLITSDEGILQGFHPERMAFPGVLIIEMMAQTAAVVCAAATLSDDGQEKQQQPGAGYLVSVDSSFEGSVFAGNILRAEIKIIKAWGRFIMASGKVTADDVPVGEARFTIAVAGG